MKLMTEVSIYESYHNRVSVHGQVMKENGPHGGNVLQTNITQNITKLKKENYDYNGESCYNPVHDSCSSNTALHKTWLID